MKTMGFSMLPHPLTNFEIQRCYQNESRINGDFSKNSSPKKINDGAYVIGLDEYSDIGTHWIVLFCNRNEIVYFDSLVLDMFLKKLKNLLRIETKANIFRIQANN